MTILGTYAVVISNWNTEPVQGQVFLVSIPRNTGYPMEPLCEVRQGMFTCRSICKNLK